MENFFHGNIMAITRNPSRSATKSRDGFTLMEFILVLAILVALGAIIAPSVGGVFQRQKLNASADQLRSVWDRARLTAMKTGQIQAFTCTVGERSYSVAPYMTGDDTVNASAGATIVTSGGTVAETTSSGMLTAPADSSENSKTLEEDITFVSCMVNSDMRSMTVAQAQGGMVGMQAMSQSVMFYPDGSTSTAEIIIEDPTGFKRGVRMRGLTGSTQVLTPGDIPSAAPTGAQ